MKRQRKIIGKSISRSGRISMIGGFLILTVVIVVLLNLSNNYSQAQIYSTYCSDLGFKGKSLTLMKDNTFRFNYYGCSQSNGYVSGRWTAEKSVITLYPDKPDSLLDFKYKQADNRLLPMTLANDEGFIACSEYIEPWHRDAEE